MRLAIKGGIIMLLLLAGLLAADSNYIVTKGDTLYEIAGKHGISLESLLKANPGVRPESLKIGQKIIIPSTGHTPEPSARKPVFHIVAKGDTLGALARKYSLTLSQLKKANGLSGDTIYIGQKLKIGGAHQPSANQNDSPAPGDKKPAPKPLVFVKAAQREIDAPKVKDSRWKYVVVHHSGTKNGNAKIFDYFHKNIRGMENGMAYHFVIGNGTDSGDGEIEVGDRWKRQIQGGHLASSKLNAISIGICLVGNFNSSRPTRKQVASLIELVTYLKDHDDDGIIFKTHRDINPKPTECPGKYFPSKAMYRILK